MLRVRLANHGSKLLRLHLVQAVLVKSRRNGVFKLLVPATSEASRNGEGSIVMLETAQKIAAAMPRTEVSAIHVVVQYTRLLSSSLCSSHTLTLL